MCRRGPGTPSGHRAPALVPASVHDITFTLRRGSGWGWEPVAMPQGQLAAHTMGVARVCGYLSGIPTSREAVRVTAQVQV